MKLVQTALFAYKKKHRWGLGHIETCYSGPKVAVLNAQNHRWGLEPKETSKSGTNHEVLKAQNDKWGLGLIETCYSGPKVSVLHAKATDKGWEPLRLVILMLIMLLACTKRQVRSGTHRDLLCRSKICCFACKSHRWELGPIETTNSDVRHAVLHAQNDRSYLEPMETCYSGPEVAVLHAKTTRGILDPQRLVILVLK